MDISGQAAEQVVRYSLEGMEYTLKLTGKGTERLAAMLWAIATDQQQLKGRIALNALLKREKDLKVFTIPEDRLKDFVREAKKFGVLYCVLKEKQPLPDSSCDLLVRASDASKVNRMIERLGLACVTEAADLQFQPREPEEQALQAAEDLLGEILAPMETAPENPTTAQTEVSSPSGPGSTPSAQDTDTVAQMAKILAPEQRPSVRAALAQIRMEQQQNPVNDLAKATALRQITEITEGVK